MRAGLSLHSCYTTMRGGHVFVVLLASTLAIEDDERDALGAPGPTRANLRGRGLKFGHSVTDVTESETDAPAPSPTEPPSLVPTPAAAGTPAFLDSQDCADCPDCRKMTQYYAAQYYAATRFDGYDFRGITDTCICYVDTAPYLNDAANMAVLWGTDFNDCIAITGAAPGNDAGLFDGSEYKYLQINGEGGDDTIVAPDYNGVSIYGGDGTDFCNGGYRSCEHG